MRDALGNAAMQTVAHRRVLSRSLAVTSGSLENAMKPIAKDYIDLRPSSRRSSAWFRGSHWVL